MIRPRHVAWIGGVLVAGYLGLWLVTAGRDAAHQDFLNNYVGGSLLRTGLGAHIYSFAAQTDLRQAVAGSRASVNPFVDCPLLAALILPFTLLPLKAAFMAWTALQLGLVGAAVLIAVRAAAPRGDETTRVALLACGLAALAGFGTSELLHTGQCDGIAAFGLAMAYRSWRRGRPAAGGAWLVATAGIAKPHLALGTVAFLLVWRDRRVLTGAAAAAVAVGVSSLALVGPDGLVALVRDMGVVNARLSDVGMSSFAGLPSRWLNDAPLSRDIAYAGTVIGVLLCAVAGYRVRRGAMTLSAAFATVVVVSLLSAPHAYFYDTVLLAPVIAWTLASGGFLTSAVRPGTATVALLWLLVNVVSYTFFVLQDFPVVGTPSVYVTAVLAAVLWRRAGSTAPAVASAGASSGRRGPDGRLATEMTVAG